MRLSELALKALQVVSPLLMAALGWMATRLAKLINARIHSEHTRDVLLRLEQIVFTVVREVQQVMVDELKADSDNGRLSFNARERVKRAALDTVRDELGKRGLAELARVLGREEHTIDHVLVTRIEAAVHELRCASPPVKNGVNSHGPITAAT
jgi:hypothetical protein